VNHDRFLLFDDPFADLAQHGRNRLGYASALAIPDDLRMEDLLLVVKQVQPAEAAVHDSNRQIDHPLEDLLVVAADGFDGIIDETLQGKVFPRLDQTGAVRFHFHREGPLLVENFLFAEIQAHLVDQVVDVERFDEEIDGALLHRRDGKIDGGKGGDHDDADGWIDFMDVVKQVHAAHPRHHDVADDKILGLALQDLQGLDAVFCFTDVVIFRGVQGVNDDLPGRGVIIDDEDPVSSRCILSRACRLNHEIHPPGWAKISFAVSCGRGKFRSFFRYVLEL